MSSMSALREAYDDALRTLRCKRLANPSCGSRRAVTQVYAAVGRVAVIAIQPGEELVAVAACDTVRLSVGDTANGTGDALRVYVLVKPIGSGLKTYLVITTSRRTCLIELTSTEKAWMVSVSWDYPKDRMLAL